MLVLASRALRAATRLLLTALVAVVAVLLTGALPAGAATESDDVTWSVKTADNAHGENRPNYQYELRPGQSLNDAIVVTNYSDRELTFAAYAADGFLNEAAELDLLPAGEQSEHVGEWVTLGAEEVTVGAGESVSISFMLTVPPNATPGDYAGGIITSLGAADRGDGVQVDRRLGSRLMLRVDGEVQPRLSIRDVAVEHTGSWLPWQPGEASVSFTLENTGNVRLTGVQAVSLSGLLGIGQQTVEVELEEMLPGSVFERTVELDAVWPLVRTSGALTVEATAVVGDSQVQVSEDIAFWTVPWSLLIVLLLLAGLIVLSRVRKRRRRAAEDRRVAAAVAAAVAAHTGDEPVDGAPGDDPVDGGTAPAGDRAAGADAADPGEGAAEGSAAVGDSAARR